jgi:hypothetical protein
VVEYTRNEKSNVKFKRAVTRHDTIGSERPKGMGS